MEPIKDLTDLIMFADLFTHRIPEPPNNLTFTVELPPTHFFKMLHSIRSEAVYHPEQYSFDPDEFIYQYMGSKITVKCKK